MVELRGLFESYKRCVLRVVVRGSNGDLHNGTAFHIGDGWLVTAAHVVRDAAIKAIETVNDEPVIPARVIFHSDRDVDLALIESDFNLDSYMSLVVMVNPPTGFEKIDHLPIGGHLDDWIGDEFVLSKVPLMGHPPIPLARPTIFAAEGEVNAVIDRYSSKPRHPFFLVSCMPRGGFSGGPVISEWGFVLGVVTEAVVVNGQPVELGYTSAISIEPLLDMLHANKV